MAKTRKKSAAQKTTTGKVSQAAEKSRLFNIRVTDDRKRLPKEVEEVYDRVNLLCLAIGAETVKKVLTGPLKRLIPAAARRIAEAREARRLKPPFLKVFSPDDLAPEKVMAIAGKLVETAGDYCIKDFLLRPRKDFPAPAIRALLAARKHGIQIPVPESKAREELEELLYERSIDELAKAGMRFRFLDLFIMPQLEAPQAVTNAVLGVKRFGMFKWLDNQRCWSLRRCACQTQPNSFCNCNPPGCCAPLSDGCPIPPKKKIGKTVGKKASKADKRNRPRS